MDATEEGIDTQVDASRSSYNEEDIPMQDVEVTNTGDQNSDSDSGSGSEESEEETPTEWLATSRQKRSTAGNRLNTLLQAAHTEEDPEDELALLFAEGEDAHEDGGFSDHAGHDSDVQMDSSSDSENSGADDDLEGEKVLQKQEREDRQKKKRKLNDKIPIFKKRVKIDPTAIPKPTTSRPKKKSERASWIPAVEDMPTRASRRETTMQSKELLHAQMVDRELKRLRVVRKMEKANAEKESKKKPEMTQADRLAEAARIEKQNTRSLSRWEESELLREEEQRAKLAALKNRTLEGPVITWWSGMAEWFGGRLRQVGKNLKIEEPKEKGASKKKKASELEDAKEETIATAADDKSAKPDAPQDPSTQAEKATEKVIIVAVDSLPPEPSKTLENEPTPSKDIVQKPPSSKLDDSIVVSKEGSPKPIEEEAAQPKSPLTKKKTPPLEKEESASKGTPPVLDEDAPTEKERSPVEVETSPGKPTAVEDESTSPIKDNSPIVDETIPTPKAKSPTPEEELPPPPIVPLQQPLPPRSSVLAPPPGLPIQAPHPPPNFHHHQSQNAPPYVVGKPALDGSAPVPGLGFGYNFQNPPPRSALGQYNLPTASSPAPQTTPKPLQTSTSHQPPPFGFPLGQHHYHYHSQTPPPPHPQSQSTTPFFGKPPAPPTPFTPPPPPPPLVQEVKEDAPPVVEHATRNYLILQNFDETAIKDKNVQMEVVFGRKFQKLPNSRAKHNHPLCPLTSLPARYRDPTTGLPYANTFAFSQLKRLQRCEYKWSSLVGAYVGLGVSPLGGVAARGVPARFRDPKAEKEVVPVVVAPTKDDVPNPSLPPPGSNVGGNGGPSVVVAGSVSGGGTSAPPTTPVAGVKVGP